MFLLKRDRCFFYYDRKSIKVLHKSKKKKSKIKILALKITILILKTALYIKKKQLNNESNKVMIESQSKFFTNLKSINNAMFM